MAVNQRYTPGFLAGAEVSKYFLIPRLAADPVAPQEGEVWFNETDNAFRGYNGASTVTFGAGVTDEAIQDIVGAFFADSVDLDVTYDDDGNVISAIIKPDSVTNAQLADMAEATFKMRAAGAGTGNPINGTAAQAKTALAIVANDIADFVSVVRTSISATDTATLDLTYNNGTGVLSGAVLDSPKLEGSTLAQVQALITNAIIDGAPGTLDTLNEIAAALQDNPDVITEILTAQAARSRFFAGPIPAGGTFGDIEHGMTLGNMGDFQARCFVSATGIEEPYRVDPVDVDTVRVIDETGGNIPAGRRIFITVGAS
jgi:hypothetical protein